MKKILLAVILLMSTMTFSQVGIGTFTPNSSAELDVSSDEKGILIPRVNLYDLSVLDPISGSGEESLMVYNLTEDPGADIHRGYYYWKDDKWIKVLDSGDNITGVGIEPTGLERINEGNGPGWRLIGRNSAYYGNIGKDAIDFTAESNFPSTTFGANSDYSFNHGRYNEINGNKYLLGFQKPTFHVIMGGEYNNIQDSPTSNDGRGITIFGDSNNAFASITSYSFIAGVQNNILQSGGGFVIGTNNILNGGVGHSFGESNRMNRSGVSIGYGNTIFNKGYQNLIGHYNTSSVPFETVVGVYSDDYVSNSTFEPNDPDNVSSYLGYSSTTNDPVFRVGIGRGTEFNIAAPPTVHRADGFRVFRDGKVQITQTPTTNNSVTKLYGRAADGTFVLVDKSSLGGSGPTTPTYTVDYSPVGIIDLNHLETNYGGQEDFYRVYSPSENAIYTKVDLGVWVKANVTTVN